MHHAKFYRVRNHFYNQRYLCCPTVQFPSNLAMD